MPAGEEGGPGGLHKIQKEEEEKEEEIEWKRRDEKEIHDGLVVEVILIVNFPPLDVCLRMPGAQDSARDTHLHPGHGRSRTAIEPVYLC